ncbi:MAG TPA: exodeoxyribonuclease III, partial [Caulobacter sp.]|nr:exodeoxyribonuclease III [Caulobacter sp.]
LSLHPVEITARALPDAVADEPARYIEGKVATPKGPVTVGGLYLPNGNPIGTEKFDYKLAWMRRLQAHAKSLLALEEPLVILGDYNVIPEAEDVHNPEAWLGDALFQPESRAAFRALKNLGFTDAYMQVDGAPGGYTFWDYQAGAWPRNLGIRIDHVLLSPQAADRLVDLVIHRDERDKEKPSDHVPVVAELNL